MAASFISNRAPNVASWHLATNRCIAAPRSLLDEQRTLARIFAKRLGRY